MTNITTINQEPVSNKSTETIIIHSFKPCIRQYWLLFAVSVFSILLAFTKFDVKTITGLCILSISSLLIVYCMLSAYTTKYVITHQGILIRKGPFSRKFRELSYSNISNIAVRQGRMQKRLKIGTLTISENQTNRVFRGIKNPHKMKELINKEKSCAYERRTLLRKIL